VEDYWGGCIISGNCPGAEVLERASAYNVRALKNYSRGFKR